jgi:hypothetical protein
VETLARHAAAVRGAVPGPEIGRLRLGWGLLQKKRHRVRASIKLTFLSLKLTFLSSKLTFLSIKLTFLRARASARHT